MLAGIGTASFFASLANVVMGAVRPEQAGQAFGAITVALGAAAALLIPPLQRVTATPLKPASSQRPDTHTGLLHGSAR